MLDADWCRAGWHATSFQAEASAMQLALLSLYNAAEAAHQEHPKTVAILTDSQSLLRRLNRGALRQRSWQCVAIWELLTTLKEKGWKVTLQYVPSHVGLEGNEDADTAAKAAVNLIKKEHPSVPPCLPLHRGAVVAYTYAQVRKQQRLKAVASKWGQHTDGARLTVQGLTRDGERLIMGLACGQHPLVIGGWGPMAPPKRPGSSHPDCPHCLQHDSTSTDRDTPHVLLFCPTTGEIPEAMRLEDLTADQKKLCRKLLNEPKDLLDRLHNVGDVPHPPQHYYRPPAPD